MGENTIYDREPIVLDSRSPRGMGLKQGDLSDTRCVLCNFPSLTLHSVSATADGVQRSAIRCENCDGKYDVVDGVPFIGYYDSTDYPGLVEIIATANMHQTGFDISDIRKMNDVLKGYHTSLDKAAYVAREENSIARESWFSYRYHEWIQTESILAGRSLVGKSLLNVGAGYGIDSVHLLDMGAHVTCIDYSPSLVAIGRQSLPDARWFGGFSHVLPFQDESFDVVCANAALHHMRSVPVALREMLRVLKPGGFLFTTGDPFRADTSDENHEFNTFNNHVGVLSGINEGIVRFSDIYEPVHDFSEHMSIALIADVVGGEAMTGLDGTSSIGDGTFGDRWVPCWDENTNRLAASYGAIAMTATKHASVTIPGSIQVLGGLSGGALASWIAEGDAAYSRLAEWAPRAVIDLPFPGRVQTWFDLLNGWMMPEPLFEGRRGYLRARWLLTAPSEMVSMHFRIRAATEGPGREFEVTLDGVVATSALIDRHWREVEVLLPVRRTDVPLLIALRWQDGAEPAKFEDGCFDVCDRGFNPI